MLVPGGTLVCAGAAKRAGWLDILAHLLAIIFWSRVLHQRVVLYIASIRDEDPAYLKELIEAGKVWALIDRTYPLEEWRGTVRYAMSGQGRAKVVITVSYALPSRTPRADRLLWVRISRVWTGWRVGLLQVRIHRDIAGKRGRELGSSALSRRESR